MVRNFASIEFESRREVLELMRMIEDYVDANPGEKKNSILKDFYCKPCTTTEKRRAKLRFSEYFLLYCRL